MATLTEIAEWVAGIYQIEQGDPVLGGAPNETTGAGLSNVPAQQLAKRTAYLKKTLEDAGVGIAATAAVTDFNAITRGGLYYGPATATGNPDGGAAAVVLHLATASGDAAAQIALRSGTSNAVWTRRRQAGTWTVWASMILSDGLPVADLSELLAGALNTKLVTPLGLAQLLGERGFPGAKSVADLNVNASGIIAGNMPDNRPFDYPAVLSMRRADQRNGQLAVTSSASIAKLAARSQNGAGGWGNWQHAWLGQETSVGATANGYQVLPSGIIIQWFRGVFVAADGVSGTLVSLPMAFPNEMFAAVATDVGAGARPCGAAAQGLSQMRIWCKDVTGAYYSTGVQVIAIGR